MTSACFSRGHTGFSRNATLVATVNPPALAGGVFNIFLFMAYIKSRVYIVFVVGCLAASFFPIFPIAKSICHYKTDKKDIFILYVIDVMLFCMNIIIIDYILKNNL